MIQTNKTKPACLLVLTSFFSTFIQRIISKQSFENLESLVEAVDDSWKSTFAEAVKEASIDPESHCDAVCWEGKVSLLFVSLLHYQKLVIDL